MGFLKNKICINLSYVHVPKWTEVKLDRFPCLARDRKSPPQRRIVANIFGKEVDLYWRNVCSTISACLLSEVNKYTAELSLGSSRNTLSRRAQMSTEICIKLFTRRRIKGRDKRRSFPISLIFYQTILESSPQTRFMFDINKFNIINRCANFYSRRNTGCDRFARIPSNSQSRSYYWLQQSRKYRCTVQGATLCYSTTQFVIVSLCCILFSLRHEINLLRRSFS